MARVKNEIIPKKCLCCLEEIPLDLHSSQEGLFDWLNACFSIEIPNSNLMDKYSFCGLCLSKLMSAHRLKYRILDCLVRFNYEVTNGDPSPSPPSEDTHKVITDQRNEPQQFESKIIPNIRKRRLLGCDQPQRVETKPNCRRIHIKIPSRCKSLRVNLVNIEHLNSNVRCESSENASFLVDSKDIASIRSEEMKCLRSALDCKTNTDIPFIFQRSREVNRSNPTRRSRPCPLSKKNNVGRQKKHPKADAEQSFDCPVCTKVFMSRNTLSKHMTRHRDTRNHGCTMCPKSFKTHDYLNKHMLVHKQVRNYKCTLCQKGFKNTSLLKRHMISHSDVRSFECALCHKLYKTQSNVNSHMKHHHDLKRFKCNACDREFTTKWYLKKHMQERCDV